MAAGNTPSCGSYLASVTGSQDAKTELESLIGELTIGETYFFRQQEHFDFLRDRIVPEILRRNQASRRLRIWSAGCATGAEPYSVALLLYLDFPNEISGWDISIVGTDINTDFLTHARTGIFGSWALRQVPEALKDRCFESKGKAFLLRSQFRKGVSFTYNNLVSSEPYPGENGDPFDLILCRNVMIYFSREQIQKVASRLYNALGEGGWLLVGHAEPHQETFRQYAVVCESGTTAYRKGAPRQLPAASIASWQLAPLHEHAPGPLRGISKRSSSQLTRERRTPAPSARPSQLPQTLDDARVLADRGEWRASEVICRQLIEADPLLAANHFTLGLVLQHISTPEQAQAAFRRAIYLDRSFAMAHYHLGASQQACASLQQARKSFENVIGLLDKVPGEEPVACSDGMTAAELRELARMHLESLQRI
jgi:chemotaxis protein methyltransferase CheR